MAPKAVNEAGEIEQISREKNPALFLAHVSLTTSELALSSPESAPRGAAKQPAVGRI